MPFKLDTQLGVYALCHGREVMRVAPNRKKWRPKFGNAGDTLVDEYRAVLIAILNS